MNPLENELKITGEMLIGGAAVRGTAAELQAIDPSNGQVLSPLFGGGGQAEVDRACALAAEVNALASASNAVAINLMLVTLPIRSVLLSSETSP